MEIELQRKEFVFADKKVGLFVPKEDAVRARYASAKSGFQDPPFPYWAKVWPAAVGLGTFIQKHPHYLANKDVLELAAGLGLPSLVAAFYARTVCISDYVPEAITIIGQSAALNAFENVNARQLDWNHLPQDLDINVLLLSDINYDPAEFKVLQEVLHFFLKKGTTILLSTPQRLIAKAFIEPLLSFSIETDEIEVSLNERNIMISLFVLKSK